MSLFSSVLSVCSPKTFKIVDYEDELDLLSVVAVTQIDAEGKAHLDFHCNEYGTLLKSIPLVESWDVVSRVHGIQSGTSSLYRSHLLKQMHYVCVSPSSPGAVAAWRRLLDYMQGKMSTV